MEEKVQQTEKELEVIKNHLNKKIKNVAFLHTKMMDFAGVFLLQLFVVQKEEGYCLLCLALAFVVLFCCFAEGHFS